MELPFIVRLFLQNKDQVGTSEGSECSGTIIDNHWIATSFDCCQDIIAYRLINFGRMEMTQVETGIIGIGPLNHAFDDIQEISRKIFVVRGYGVKILKFFVSENSEKYDICLIRTNYDIINLGTSNGSNPSKICLTDKVS